MVSGSKEDSGPSGNSGSNDFVKKLYQMLLQDKYRDVVRWTPQGKSFVVLNTNEFTKVILPTHFKHSNFASFVRQLNKYDFHKVKISNEEKRNYEYGDDAWEFQHPDFRQDDMDALENIRRKPPLKKESPSEGREQLYSQIHSLRAEVIKLQNDLRVTNEKYKAVSETVLAQRTYNDCSYRFMGVLIHALNQAGIEVPPFDLPNPNLISMVQPNNHAQSVGSRSSRKDKPLSKSSIPQMTASVQNPIKSVRDKFKSENASDSLEAHQQPQHQVSQETPQSRPQSGDSSSHPSSFAPVSTTQLTNPKFNVLLVEDDNVCIQLCRKFLMKYGCQVTIVTDGLNAISTVEQTKFDLVLMDIVMPNLDGATATSIIRSFDTKTPIIAMTGNIQDNDLVSYLQNGMSDILAKPFTKDDLYSILSKYLLGPKSELLDSPPVPEYQAMALQGNTQQVVPQPMATMSQAPNASLVPSMVDSLDPMEPATKKQRI